VLLNFRVFSSTIKLFVVRIPFALAVPERFKVELLPITSDAQSAS